MSFTTVVLLLMTIVVSYGLPSSHSSCNSIECIEAASRILKDMDPNEDPCDDFYKYSCGRFKDRHPLRDQSKVLDRLALLQEKVDKRVKTILEDDRIRSHRSRIVRKAKKLYDDCLEGKNPLFNQNDSKKILENYVEKFSYLIPRRKTQVDLQTLDRKLLCHARVSTEYYYVIIRLYADKYFPSEDYKESRRVVLDVKDVFVEDVVNKIPWINENTKQMILSNLTELTVNTGYHEWISDDKELEKEYEGGEDGKHQWWPMPPLLVNAFFGGYSITITAAILQAPVFDRNLPHSLNYGAAGSIAGHELSHGLDQWTTEEVLGRNRSFSCLADQVENIIEPQTGLKYSNGSELMAEMLADVGSINASLIALKKVLGEKAMNDQLPGLTGFTHSQLFFLSHANVSSFLSRVINTKMTFLF